MVMRKTFFLERDKQKVLKKKKKNEDSEEVQVDSFQSI